MVLWVSVVVSPMTVGRGQEMELFSPDAESEIYDHIETMVYRMGSKVILIRIEF